MSKQHATKVVEQIVEEFEDQMPKKYVPHAEVKLLELEGKLIELAIRFEGGVVDVVGRVRLVKGGESCDTVLWVGEACVSVDAIVYLDGIRKYWVFESTRYNKPKR